MNVLDKAAKFIAEFEGCKLSAYRDQRGVWTVGFGATGPGINGNTKWTMEQAEDRFDRDLDIRLKQLSSFLDGASTTDNQLIAMLSLMYNIGAGAFHNSTALKKHIQGDYEGAARAILMWNKTNGQPNPGLTRRRKAEHDLYLSED